MYKINDSLVERQTAKEKSDRLFLLWVALIVAIMTVIMALNQFVFFTVQVKGQSMQPTLYTNDFLIANRLKKVERGSIIIIEGETGYWLIKRVIACDEGDKIELKDGYVYLNGVKLNETYVLQNGVTEWNSNEQNGQTVELKAGEIFYLGDNRQNSSDSRNYGTCEDGQVVGVVEEWSLPLKGIGGFFALLKQKLSD